MALFGYFYLVNLLNTDVTKWKSFGDMPKGIKKLKIGLSTDCNMKIYVIKMYLKVILNSALSVLESRTNLFSSSIDKIYT